MPTYPPPPWNLRGWGIQTLHAIPIGVARRYVPAQLPIIQIWPGYTLATVLFASYEDGSLTYHELLLGIGLVWLRGPRFCIPRLWVDSNASVAGGREIWKLPKELATFDVRQTDRQVRVTVDDICRIDTTRSPHSVPLWLPALAFGQSGSTFFPFNAYMRSDTSLAHVRVTWLHPELAALQLEHPLLSLHYESLDLVVHAPAVGVGLSGNL